MKDSITLEEALSVEILDRHAGRLRNKDVASVKVLWGSLSIEGATWKVEVTMNTTYPYFFPFDFVSS